MPLSHLDVPIDDRSARRLAEGGLRLALATTVEERAAWIAAEARGFHDVAPTAASLAADLEGLAFRRTTGVWDPSGPDPLVPVATVGSFPLELTVPGERAVAAWAISSVTVAPTHRRRGIARALLEAELRTAAACGLPFAMLTVTEATIYGRYGFGPAAFIASWTLERARARWAGPAARSRVAFVDPRTLRADGPAIAERARRATVGAVERWPLWWDRLLGLVEPESERSRAVRAVRADDESGVPQGFAVYRITDADPLPATVVLDQLVAATDDAYAALWRFLAELDLVAEVRAALRPVDERLPWLLDDVRAAHKTDERDHLWLRVLDLEAALASRRYAAPARFALEVDDALGLASGVVVVTVAEDGSASVEREAALPASIPGLALPVSALGSLLLGGVPASTLAAAGRVREIRPGDALALDGILRVARAPHLDFWF